MPYFGLQMPHFAYRNTQHLLKTTSIPTLSSQHSCTIQINALPLQQHTYPASRKNSALRVSFFYEHDITILQPVAYYGWRANTTLEVWGIVPRRTRLPFVTIPSDTKKVYYVLSIILYLLQTINPNNTFVTRFKSLLAKYPSVDVNAMGFPSGNWQDEPLWSTQS